MRSRWIAAAVHPTHADLETVLLFARGRSNRDKLMVGPSTFFGKMALYQSGNVTGVIDRHGRPKMVTLPGRAPEVDTSAPVIGLPRGLPKTMITGRWISRNSKNKPT